MAEVCFHSMKMEPFSPGLVDKRGSGLILYALCTLQNYMVTQEWCAFNTLQDEARRSQAARRGRVPVCALIASSVAG
jgi:hypothetical protein